MATISQIRKRSGLVIAIIGIAIFAFIISDAIQSNQYLFSEKQTTVGVVGGEEISYMEYGRDLDMAIKNYKARTQGQKIDPMTERQLNDQAWNQKVYKIIFEKEFEDLGLTVTEDELFKLVSGENPHPSIKQAFTNPQTGQFDRNQLVMFLKNINSEAVSDEMRSSWFAFEQSLMEERKQTKYFELINKGLYVTDLEAKQNFNAKNKFANFRYISLLNSSVPDSTIEIKDGELKDYFNEHEKEFEQEASRTIEYVVFDIHPSKKDTEETLNWIKRQKTAFAREKNDSLFVELNSDKPFDTLYHGRGELGDSIDKYLFDAEVGTIYGPYFEAGTYNIAKLVDVEKDSLPYYRASHILIKPEGSKDEDTAKAMKEARDIMSQIRNGSATFENMARQHGEDGTATRGGDLGWFKKESMVPKFADAVAKGNKGDMFTVKTRFGAHVVKVTEDPSMRKVRVAIVSREILPGNKTYDEVYNNASQLRSQVSSSSDFEKVSKEQGLNVRIAEDIKADQRVIPGFSRPGQVIRWAYTNEKGSISDIMDFEDKYVIAHLRDVKNEGVADFESVKEDIRSKVLKNKKLEMLHKKMVDAAGNDKSLDNAAKKLNETIREASNINFSNNIVPGLGDEKYVIGTVFGLDEGMTSRPVKGESGVFMINVTSMSAVEPPASLKQTKEELKAEAMATSQTKALEALKEEAKVKDYRYKFY